MNERLLRLKQPVWLRRFATLTLMAGAYATGVWSDLTRGRWPDYFDVQTAVVAMIFAWVVAEALLPVFERSAARGRKALPLAAATGIVYAALANALPTFLSGLLQVPFGGLAMALSTVDGLWFTLRQAWLPSVVCGVIGGVLCAAILQARQAR